MLLYVIVTLLSANINTKIANLQNILKFAVISFNLSV